MKTHILAFAAAALTSAAAAQGVRPSGPPMDRSEFGPPNGRGGLATMLIDARRELNLTPRQLLALDSLERMEYSRRRQDMDAMRNRRDSVCAKRDPCDLTREEMQQIRRNAVGQLSTRLRTDSATRSKIFGMLDTTQRRLADRLEYRRELLGRGRGSRQMMRETGTHGLGPQRFGPPWHDRGDRMGPGHGPRRWEDGFGPGAPQRERREEPPRGRRWRPELHDSLPPDSTARPSAPVP